MQFDALTACSSSRTMPMPPMLSVFFEATGCEVVTAYGGQPALMVARDRRPLMLLSFTFAGR